MNTQKYKPICTKSARHQSLGLEPAFLAAATTRPRGTGFWREVGGVLERIGAELVAEAEIEVLGGGATRFSGIGASIQEVDCGNSLPCRRHRVRSDLRELRPVSVTDLVTTHLKDLCHWHDRIIKPMLDLHRGKEFLEMVVEEGGAVVGNVASPDILLRSTEITNEVISVGGWHSVHKPADCDGQFFDRKKKRKLLSSK